MKQINLVSLSEWKRLFVPFNSLKKTKKESGWNIAFAGKCFRLNARDSNSDKFLINMCTIIVSYIVCLISSLFLFLNMREYCKPNFVDQSDDSLNNLNNLLNLPFSKNHFYVSSIKFLQKIRAVYSIGASIASFFLIEFV